MRVTPRSVDADLGGLPPQGVPALSATERGTGWHTMFPRTDLDRENPQGWEQPDYTTAPRPARMPMAIKTAVRAFQAVAEDDFGVRMQAPPLAPHQGFGNAQETWRQRANIANRRAPAFGSTFTMDPQGGFSSDVFALTPGVQK